MRATRDGHITPMRVALSSTHTPVEALRALRGSPGLFALTGEWGRSAAILGSHPLHVANPREDPFAVLDRLPALAEWEPAQARADRDVLLARADRAVAREDGVGGGWFGYLGYSLGERSGRAAASPPGPPKLPAFHLAFYDHLLRCDAHGHWWFEALHSDARAHALDERLRLLRQVLAAPAPPAAPYAFTPWRASPSVAAHGEAVAACTERISHGDLYQANLSLRLHSRLAGDALDAFCAGVTRLRPGRGAFLSGPWGAVVSFSPELYLSRHGQLVRSAPIKGTCKAPAGAHASRLRERRLERSEKERTENVMIVDLVRNDLGRVCDYGSVRVRSLARASEQAGVLNLVSQVEGRVRSGTPHAELLRATFPPGSVTGAPKLAALEVIAELESAPREVYTGAIGFASPLAGLELSVAIRTLECHAGAASMGVGGGITADSTPRAEAKEVQTKARPVLQALGGGLADERVSRPLGRPRRYGPMPCPRPDPARGVFETMLVVGGRVPRLQAHLLRLAASARALYGLTIDERAGSDVLAAVAAIERGRVRLVATPRGDGLALEIEPGVLATQADALAPVDVTLVTLAGGLGAHKWRDRRLIDTITDAAGCLPLFVDLDGYLLEASRASVFLVLEASLLTPPLDGRILPSTTRARMIARARRSRCVVAERPLHQSELARADGIFLASSLRGIEPVSAVDGRPTDFACSQLVAPLAAGLATGARPRVEASCTRQVDGTVGCPGSGAPSLETSGAS